MFEDKGMPKTEKGQKQEKFKNRKGEKRKKVKDRKGQKYKQ